MSTPAPLYTAMAAALLAAACLPAGVLAQPASAPLAADAARADAAAPPVTYRSPFATYRPHTVVTPGPWRGMNDEVARIGGWKAYAREAHEAAQAAEAARQGKAAPAPVPATGGVTPASPAR